MVIPLKYACLSKKKLLQLILQKWINVKRTLIWDQTATVSH